MKVSLYSDLHLEWSAMPPMPGGETILLSGDIQTACVLSEYRTDKRSRYCRDIFKAFFTELSEKYQNIYYIMGNHEHYGNDFDQTVPILRQFFETYPKIKFLNKEVAPFTENTMIFGGTMWTSMNDRHPIAMIVAKRGMNDFAGAIKKGNFNYTPEDSVLQHEETLTLLKKALSDYPGKEFFVMTHHTPSFKSLHPRFGQDVLNYAYSSDLDKFILDNPRIKHWVHGHTHDSFDYMIGDCRVLCNPRGYARDTNDPPENSKFNINLTFEVN